MKTAEFTIEGGAYLINEDANHDLIDKYGVMTLQWHLAAGDPVEAVVLEWDVKGDDLHVVCLMSEDHAARFAVAPETTNVEWPS